MELPKREAGRQPEGGRIASARSPRWSISFARPGHWAAGFISRLAKLKQIPSALRESRGLFAFARGHLWYLPVMMVLALLTSIFEGIGLTLVIPLVQALGADSGAQNQQGILALIHQFVAAIPIHMRLLAVVAAILAAVIAKSVLSYANMALLVLVYGRLSHNLRKAVFARIISTPLARVERERSGKLLNVLTTETWRVSDALNLIFMMITSLSTILVFLGLLILLSWRLSLIVTLFIALIPPLTHLISRRAKTLSARALAANEALAQQTWSTLNGLRTIHTFGRHSFELKRFNTASNAVRRLFLRMALISMTAGPVTEILATVLIASLIIMVDSADVGFSTLIGFIAILYRLQPRLLSLVSAQANLASLHASIEAVSQLLASEEAAPPEPGKLRFERLGDSVSLKGVTFTYPGEPQPALVNLSFELRPGKLIAVVGSSGAGKSTLLDLLLRFQTPQQGSILVDGVPLNDIAIADWRGRIGVVNQDPYVFDDTIRANIMFGRPEASETEMIEAARFVAADDFIRALPAGYDTVVGERGTQISGGQRQRIAMARALLRDPHILLLDEATSALDTLTERAIRSALRRFAETGTVLVVAHRLAMVEDADHVLVLDQGRLVEQGNPAALLRGNGPFARMFAFQRLDPRDESSGSKARMS